jgi:dinuclear metal center YbgI/SA1388 family protein
MDLTTLVERLNDRLRVADYAECDPSANGLQVAGPETVETVAFAVDAARATIDAAIDLDADCLVVHHGVSWGGIERVTGQAYDRIAPLLRNDCALYAAHLPLDGHSDLGNASGIADALALDDREPFALVGDEPVGLRGRLEASVAVGDLVDELRPHLDTGPGSVRTLDFGPERVEDVAITTGAGADYVDAAADAGADCLVTGEGKGRTYHDAREAGLHVVLGGHYATETFGVRALHDLVDGWGVETTYVDHPTGL